MPKTIPNLLLLGDPRLYETAEPVAREELEAVREWVARMHAVILEIRQRYGFGRAIAAPQLGIRKRLVYMYIDQPVIIINPSLSDRSEEMFECWDDCMSFPNLLVRVARHRQVTMRYRDENWEEKEWRLSDGLSELMQHEYDHLEGILCTMRAIDEKSFRWRP